jgi:hypothetical protein
MEGGALTVMQPRHAKQTNCFLRRRFFAKWEGEGGISVPNEQSHNILIYKELVKSKRGINSYLTNVHSYFIIVPQSPEEVLIYENTYTLGTLPRGYYPAGSSQPIVQ